MPRWLLKYFCIAWIGGICVFFFPYAMLLLAIGGIDLSMAFVQGTWSKWMLWAPGATLDVRGREHIDGSRPTVFISNHQSTLDVPALFLAVWPVKLRFVAKKIIQWVPFLGWYMKMTRHVFVDRANKRSAHASLEKAAGRIREGTSILVFAEGTRSETGEVLPFKKAMFALPQRAGVPIIPIAVEGSRVVMPKNSWSVQPGLIRVNIGKPIDPAAFGDDREALARHVRDAIIDLHREIGGQGGDKANAIERVGRKAEEVEA